MPMKTTALYSWLSLVLLALLLQLNSSANGQSSADYDAKTLADLRAKAEGGDAQSQCELGIAFYDGTVGLQQDKSEAVKWYRKAAEQNEVWAQAILGNCYYNGQGVTKDFTEAVKWYRKAAEQNNDLAQYCLGVCYYNGQGVTKDEAQAETLYRKAASQGNIRAKDALSALAEKTPRAESQRQEELHVQPQSQSATSESRSATKRAYSKIAKSHATGLVANVNQGVYQMDMAQMQAAKKNLFADLRAMGEVDPELKGIIDDFDKSEDELFAAMQEMEQLPQADGLMDGILSFYYGATFQFKAGFDHINRINSQSDEVKRRFGRMLQAVTKNEVAVLMLPRVARKLSGPTAQNTNLVNVHIVESIALDQLTLVNQSGRTLHNCTVVVFLTGKTGELKQNVHFVEAWPKGSPLYAQYQAGQEILNRMVFRQTVTRIQHVQIDIYCDEFTCEGISYQYAGAEKDKVSNAYDEYKKRKLLNRLAGKE